MSYTHLKDTRPRARKPYRCYLCELPIAIGEVHVKRSGKHGNVLRAVRMHALCESLTRGWNEDDWMCYDPSEFREGIPAKPADALEGDAS